jgi:hypothetical protein
MKFRRSKNRVSVYVEEAPAWKEEGYMLFLLELNVQHI